MFIRSISDTGGGMTVEMTLSYREMEALRDQSSEVLNEEILLAMRFAAKTMTLGHK